MALYLQSRHLIPIDSVFAPTQDPKCKKSTDNPDNPDNPNKQDPQRRQHAQTLDEISEAIHNNGTFSDVFNLREETKGKMMGGEHGEHNRRANSVASLLNTIVRLTDRQTDKAPMFEILLHSLLCSSLSLRLLLFHIVSHEFKVLIGQETIHTVVAFLTLASTFFTAALT